jgi:transcriptional regulator with XRE-family HTH domain
MGRLGAELRSSRQRRHLTQASVARTAGLSPSAVSDIERGWGGSYSTDALELVAGVVGRSLRFELTADPLREPSDAGHVAIQELVLRLARGRSVTRTFELATKPAEPARSADVGLRDDTRRLLEIIECWNTIGDVGAATRSSERKRAEAEQLAVAIGPIDEHGVAQPYRVRLCWVIRATALNRALVARYPEVFATRFRGSSSGWARALTEGTEPPEQPGLVWCDAKATRLFAWRRRV